MKHWLFFIVLLLGPLFTFGCARTADFTLVSTKNVVFGTDKAKSKGIQEGEDTIPIICFIPLGQPNLKDAVDNALEKGGGNVMVNAVIYVRNWYIPLLYGEVSYVVRGEVYQLDETAHYK